MLDRIEDYTHLGQLSIETDPEWIGKHSIELHEDGAFALGQLDRTIKNILKTDFSDYKKDVAAAKKSDMIIGARRAMLTFFDKHIRKAAANVTATQNMILRQTEPESPSDATKAMLLELRRQEIRTLLRQTDPKLRHDRIKGNLEFIQAAASSPDDIVSKDFVVEARRELAFKNNPDLILEEKKAKQLYDFVRKRAGEINASGIKMLILSKLDDPLPASEHYAVFPPKNEHEAAFVKIRLDNEIHKTGEIERKKKFEEESRGINLEVQDRQHRMQRL